MATESDYHIVNLAPTIGSSVLCDGKHHENFVDLIRNLERDKFGFRQINHSSATPSQLLSGSHQNLVEICQNGSELVAAARRRVLENFLKSEINPGYITDDESSDHEEPVDSGRTRSATKKASQSIQESSKNQAQSNVAGGGESQAGGSRGRKRKQVSSNGDGSDSDKDEGNKKSRVDVEPNSSIPEEAICSCPKNVMKCIGILPSLPIISCLYDSDSSLSNSNDDLTYTVLPTVSRDHGSKEC